MYEKRERLVKASRDVTMYSKKVIFQVHRLNSKNKESVLEQAERDLANVKMDHVTRVAKELQGSEFWKFRRAYTPGMQEYVEAAAFLEFCKNGRLLTLDDLNESFAELKDASSNDFQLNLLDYLLGVGDLTGELMRLAISSVTDGEVDSAKSICNFVRSLYMSLSLISQEVDDSWEMKQKMEVMLQSLMKIENTCYTVHVRGSEYFPGAVLENIEGQRMEDN
ncbi:hypothetical protein GOP47_0016506 [Adiantum capillus-veneris]|uniref:Translin-associated protein X n=1 Tax=Adiantum capillus-veneris TaxID=13818 RepID=A0A9D4UIU0_ADICA|nr:hypothetical protein GOP47_0016506 [Adiantum capillus-veneris]